MEHFYLFLVMSIALILTPGADTGLVTKNTIAYGKGGGAATACGTASGILVHTMAAALGLSAILAQSAFLFEIVKYIGAAYLIYLGIASLRSIRKGSVHSEEGEDSQLKGTSCFKQGVLTNVLNPKVAVFFLTFLPQFVDANGHTFLQILGMGVTYAVLLIIWLLFYVYLLNYLRAWMQKPSTQKAFQGVTGLVLIGFGLKLALEKR
ncbi:LysE family translocator [Aneurinibacillus terranovensis]|uniref:LysE family translocator n=1 Tax=Aneurinibacillus terranovensis TaxID=278991 RepID=UPI0004006E5B|nr:LysE family translocator [Aneurinibacillus terranovensis]